MSGILWLPLLLQDPLEQQIDESLRRFEAADEVGEALALLSSQLAGLGAPAAVVSALGGAVKKRETAEETSITLPTILAGGGTLVLLALLAAEVLRKG